MNARKHEAILCTTVDSLFFLGRAENPGKSSVKLPLKIQWRSNKFLCVPHIAARMLASHLSIRLPEAEMKILEQYCRKTNRTKTDVIREFIRSLGQKL